MSHLLEYIDIKDFKCFKDFHAEGFKRVNLIGGKNNVGKTAFMEACYLNLHLDNIEPFSDALIEIYIQRNIIEYAKANSVSPTHKSIFEKISSYDSESNIHSGNFKIINSKGIKSYEFDINGEFTTINSNDFDFSTLFTIKNITFIPNVSLPNLILKTLFESVQMKDEETNLYKFINEFDNNIENFKIIGGDKPQCKTTNGEYRNINEFGDGLKHYISIICSLYACKNGYLFIDEIDNGIHYTHLDRLWRIIFNIAGKQNVQVFATTHSKEMIESYARVSKKLDNNDISFIELGRDKENKVQALTMNFDRFQDELDNQNEVRGW